MNIRPLQSKQKSMFLRYLGEAFHAAVHQGGKPNLRSHHVIRDGFVLARIAIMQSMQISGETIKVFLFRFHLLLQHSDEIHQALYYIITSDLNTFTYLRHALFYANRLDLNVGSSTSTSIHIALHFTLLKSQHFPD